MREEQWPAFAKITVTALLLTTLTMVVAVALMTLSSPVTARDAQIRLLQDRLREAERQVADLKEYRRAVDEYDIQRKQWEAEKKTEQLWRASVDERLATIQGVCIERHSRVGGR